MLDGAESESGNNQPTRVRFLVVALCAGMSVLLYLDRFALTPITTTILRELKLDEEEFGRAIGAFFLVYALCQVPAGWLSDTLGARWTLALYVIGWSLAIAGMGLASGLITVTAMRMVLGAAQAGAYPAAASLLKRWIPLAGRGRANTIVSMGGRGGNLLAQFLTPLFVLGVAAAMHQSQGAWRIVLAIYGSLGLVWAVLFVWLYRDDPVEHPWSNRAEVELIGRPSYPTKSTMDDYGRLVKGLTKSREIWLLCVMGVAVNIGWVFLVTWLPRFLIVRHKEALEAFGQNAEVVAGMLTALAGLSAMVGSVAGGAAADRFVFLYGHKWGRRLPGLTAGFVTLGLYLIAMQLTNLWLLIAVMIVIAFTIDFGLGASWASYQDIGGRHVAMVLGLGNMCGNFGAAYFGWYIGALAKGGQWNAVFLIAGLSMGVYATGWLFFDATQPIVREEKVA